MTKQRKCNFCGTTFRPNNGKQQFCSLQCRRGEARRRHQAGLQTQPCKLCGSLFLQRRKNQLFCCSQCAQAWYRKHVYAKYTYKICPFCGRRFFNSKGRKYCSTDCASLGQMLAQQKGHINPSAYDEQVLADIESLMRFDLWEKGDINPKEYMALCHIPENLALLLAARAKAQIWGEGVMFSQQSS